MSGVREQKREDLQNRLIAATSRQISLDGLNGLRARDIAKEANCALGSLYTVYKDLDDLIMRVNSKTLGTLGEVLNKTEDNLTSPGDVLVGFAMAYLEFAASNLNLWSAIFDHRLPEGGTIPDWYIEEQNVLFEKVSAQVAKMQPDLTEQEAGAKARTLFAAAHGIVTLSLHEGFMEVPLPKLKVELSEFVKNIVVGMSHQPNI